MDGIFLSKKPILFLLFFRLLTGGLLARECAVGQSGHSQVADEQSRIQVRVELVNVLATVTDKKNRLVTDLTRDDFRVFEFHDQHQPGRRRKRR
jgi:hypothetical protein